MQTLVVERMRTIEMVPASKHPKINESPNKVQLKMEVHALEATLGATKNEANQAYAEQRRMLAQEANNALQGQKEKFELTAREFESVANAQQEMRARQSETQFEQKMPRSSRRFEAKHNTASQNNTVKLLKQKVPYNNELTKCNHMPKNSSQLEEP